MTQDKKALIELHKDWADMTPDEREAFLKEATEAIYGKGTYVPKDARGGGSTT
jgi:hypothetical protein